MTTAIGFLAVMICDENIETKEEKVKIEDEGTEYNVSIYISEEQKKTASSS